MITDEPFVPREHPGDSSASIKQIFEDNSHISEVGGSYEKRVIIKFNFSIGEERRGDFITIAGSRSDDHNYKFIGIPTMQEYYNVGTGQPFSYHILSDQKNYSYKWLKINRNDNGSRVRWPSYYEVEIEVNRSSLKESVRKICTITYVPHHGQEDYSTQLCFYVLNATDSKKPDPVEITSSLRGQWSETRNGVLGTTYNYRIEVPHSNRDIPEWKLSFASLPRGVEFIDASSFWAKVYQDDEEGVITIMASSSQHVIEKGEKFTIDFQLFYPGAGKESNKTLHALRIE